MTKVLNIEVIIKVNIMQNLNDRIMVLYPGDQMPQMTNDAMKIYLAGTMDFGSQENDWQTKFANGIVQLTDPIKGILMYKTTRFVIFNPHVPPQNQTAPDLNNPEFVQTMQWRMQMQDMADIVFINIMNKSKSPVPILEFGSNLRSGKMIVRCGEQNIMYSQIRLYCEKYNVPLLNGTANVKDILLMMGSFVSKFQQDNPQNPGLPS